ncbi:putative rlpA-like protein, double-psi beta-barrel [Helianthus annuus]|nr:putative rlpA-like protein, double-psi beta-barrel [Helianthus annuus]KAJ0640394.1 putative rlpA-like protein, double-psi beta-barrel [Helianthus annuus]KAJ0644339.1 putative rlpA-like protein, double-psi beta-barrel [Helianthus annuus]KAJ0820646.1 putative expansin/Lol pI, expansin, cellulose-binding-like domain superfamily [Helianthus annuus]
MVSIPFTAVTILLLNLSSCLCVRNNTFGQKGFSSALATWYGDETGSGSGGACGWEDDVKYPPFSSMIAAGNANIFLKGKGCGHCFQACLHTQIFCSRQPYCSGKPVTVTISDECPGACNDVPFHFDLSGFAFGSMANPGQDHNLRQLGQVDVSYQRVPCSYGGTDIAFRVDKKCNPYWFGVALEYADGDGGFQSVEIAEGGTQNFVGMNNIWGAVWERDIDPSFQPPYSFRLTSADGKTSVANNVIPQSFAVGQKYLSNVNF